MFGNIFTGFVNRDLNSAQVTSAQFGQTVLLLKLKISKVHVGSWFFQ